MEKTFIPATKEAVIMVRKTLGRRKGDFNYTIIMEREDDGGYHAFCPALPGCHSQGDTYDETMENIKDAIKLYIESLIAHHDPIPQEDITIKPLRVTL